MFGLFRMNSSAERFAFLPEMVLMQSDKRKINSIRGMVGPVRAIDEAE